MEMKHPKLPVHHESENFYHGCTGPRGRKLVILNVLHRVPRSITPYYIILTEVIRQTGTDSFVDCVDSAVFDA